MEWVDKMGLCELFCDPRGGGADTNAKWWLTLAHSMEVFDGGALKSQKQGANN